MSNEPIYSVLTGKDPCDWYGPPCQEGSIRHYLNSWEGDYQYCMDTVEPVGPPTYPWHCCACQPI